MLTNKEVVQHLVAKGVPMRDIQRALEGRRSVEAFSTQQAKEARKQRVGVAL